MRPLTHASLLAGLVVLVVGCAASTDTTQQGLVLEVTESSVATTAEDADDRPPPGDPCAEAEGDCEAVASVDVDGDDLIDNVGVELAAGTITVRIATGGDIASITVEDRHIVRTDVSPRGVFVGAFPISRPRGADVVIDTKFGLGGYELFTVIGWDKGPITVPAPVGADAPEENPTNWAFPTERVSVTAECPSPGSIAIVTSEGDTSFGMPVPGGAYTETVTSQWNVDVWDVVTSKRESKNSTRFGRSAKTDTFQCDPAHVPAPIFPASAAVEDPTIVLGGAPLNNSEGYGESRPRVVYFGGSPSGYIGDIVWASWGGERAVGSGTAGYSEPGGTVADATPQPAQIIAFDVASCNGRTAYSKVQWHFPDEGQVFDASLARDVC